MAKQEGSEVVGGAGEEVHLSLQQQRWESTQMINQRSLFTV